MKKLLATLAVSSVLLAACAEGPAPNRSTRRDAVLNAMKAVYEVETLHQELEMSMSAAGEELSISGESDVDNVHQQIDMTMDMGMLGGEMQIVMDGGVIYMRSPVFADVGTEWVSMDPSKMDPAAAAQFGGFGMGTTDPSAYVGLFAGVFDVEASGEQELDGVSTTHYVGTIDLAKVHRRILGRGGGGRRRRDPQAAPDGGRTVRLARHRRRRSRSRSGSTRRGCRAGSGSRWTSGISSPVRRKPAWR